MTTGCRPTLRESATRVLPATDSTRVRGVSRLRIAALVTLAVVAVVVYAADQLAKAYVEANLPIGEGVPVIGNLLQFYFVKNAGAAFSIASGSTWIFSIAATAVTIVIFIFARRIRSMAWAILFGMLLGGTTGNLTDRLLREPGFGVGHVVDFIQVAGFPAVFNVADCFIVSSMGLFIILSIRGTRLDGSRSDGSRNDTTDNQRSQTGT